MKCYVLKFLNVFSWFQTKIHWKTFKKKKKGWERLKKSVLTWFWVCAAPESWLKYTTVVSWSNLFATHELYTKTDSCFKSFDFLYIRATVVFSHEYTKAIWCIFLIQYIFGCGESIKDFLTLVFWGSVLGVSVFVTSNDLINRGYKTDGV